MSRPNTVLLVGRTEMVMDHVQDALRMPDITLLSATDIEGVRRAFSQATIDAVFMGAGIDLDRRLDIIRAIFESSDTTTVHMKDHASGPGGFLPFVRAILTSLDDEAPRGADVHT